MVEQYGTPLSIPVVMLIIGGFFVIFALLAGNRLSFLNRPGMLILGALTYPLYLLHERIGFCIMRMLGYDIDQNSLLWGLIVAILVLSLLVHLMVERPLMPRLKRALENNLLVPAGRRPVRT